MISCTFITLMEIWGRNMALNSYLKHKFFDGQMTMVKAYAGVQKIYPPNNK